MKIERILLFLFAGILLFFGLRPMPQKEQRGIWISYIELSQLLDQADEQEFTQRVTRMMDNIEELNLNTLYVHASAFTDAYYHSDYYSYARGVSGDYDPLKIMIREAHRHHFKVEAWINPLRSFRTDRIPQSGIIKQWIDEKNGTWIVEHEGRYYLNPAYPEVRKTICMLVRELAENYDIEGIHLDDYFYPEGINENFDHSAFLGSGSSSLSEFRKANITQLVREIHDTVKAADSHLRFGISPAGNMEYCINTIYGDVREWVKEGIVDYLAPQIYFGHEHARLPFEECLKQWIRLTEGTDVDLLAGLAAYKINTVDHYAKEGKYEWQTHQDILKRQVGILRRYPQVKGFSIFSYKSVFEPEQENRASVETEMEALKVMLQQ